MKNSPEYHDEISIIGIQKLPTIFDSNEPVCSKCGKEIKDWNVCGDIPGMCASCSNAEKSERGLKETVVPKITAAFYEILSTDLFALDKILADVEAFLIAHSCVLDSELVITEVANIEASLKSLKEHVSFHRDTVFKIKIDPEDETDTTNIDLLDDIFGDIDDDY